MSTKNTIVWCDIPVNNLERATNFYGAVLGAKLETLEMGPMKFSMLPHFDENVSGCLAEMKGEKPSLSGPLIYLNCNGRLDEAIAIAEKSGGKLLVPKHQIGPYGYKAVIADTEGNRVALHSK